jgi:hypothetical protein
MLYYWAYLTTKILKGSSRSLNLWAQTSVQISRHHFNGGCAINALYVKVELRRLASFSAPKKLAMFWKHLGIPKWFGVITPGVNPEPNKPSNSG